MEVYGAHPLGVFMQGDIFGVGAVGRNLVIADEPDLEIELLIVFVVNGVEVIAKYAAIGQEDLAFWSKD